MATGSVFCGCWVAQRDRLHEVVVLLRQNAGIWKVVFKTLRVEAQQAIPSFPPRRFQPRNLCQLDDSLV